MKNYGHDLMDEQEITNTDLTTVNTEIISAPQTDMTFTAEVAEKKVAEINTIMATALKITTEKDWIIIGGNPYLQESGAAKVRALFGVTWRINPQAEIETYPDGHRTYTYYGDFSFRGSEVSAVGSRSSKDDFFEGKQWKKTPDQIDMKNVKKAAYTNCIARGIKEILPGLRNIDIKLLSDAGLDINKIDGYGFKSGNDSAPTQDASTYTDVCSKCGKKVSPNVAKYSKSKLGALLCINCQNEAKK